MSKYIIAVLLTLFVECLISGIQSRSRDWVVYTALVNLITNPTVNLIYNGIKPLLRAPQRYALTAVLEAAVVIIEGILFYKYRKKDPAVYKAWSFRRSLLYSFMLNASSFLFGILVNFGLPFLFRG